MRSQLISKIVNVIILTLMVFSLVSKVNEIKSLKKKLEEVTYQKNVYEHNFKLCKHLLRVK